MKNFTPEKYYHIYLRDKCVVPMITEGDFEQTWMSLRAMVGLMRTEYQEEDLSYEVVKTTPPTEEHSYWRSIHILI